MSAKTILGLALAFFVAAGSLTAGELKSGLQPGDSVGAFQVKKVAGAKDDGVKTGAELCYRCKLQDRPVVMVFARSADKELAQLVKTLDKEVAEHKDKKLSSFVNLIGEKPEALSEKAKKLAEENKVENVAFVVPADHKNGPEGFKINPEADLTVIIYREGKVHANHAFEKGKLDKKSLEQIVADSSKMLN